MTTRIYRTIYLTLTVIIFQCTSFAVWASGCNLINKPNVDGLYIGMPAKVFLQTHPTANIGPSFGSKQQRLNHIGFFGDDAESKKPLAHAGEVFFIFTLDEFIYAYAISYLGAGVTNETSLEDFQNIIIQRYNLPKLGWIKYENNSVKLVCNNIEIRLHQSNAIDDDPMMFVRDIHLSELADRLKQ
ncbi:MAG: hypothetical protein LWW76_05355 [Burkholderiales bacterium]|nr:hypothetical protein [Burkholderiales bacterium]